LGCIRPNEQGEEERKKEKERKRERDGRRDGGGPMEKEFLSPSLGLETQIQMGRGERGVDKHNKTREERGRQREEGQKDKKRQKEAAR